MHWPIKSLTHWLTNRAIRAIRAVPTVYFQYSRVGLVIKSTQLYASRSTYCIVPSNRVDSWHTVDVWPVVSCFKLVQVVCRQTPVLSHLEHGSVTYRQQKREKHHNHHRDYHLKRHTSPTPIPLLIALPLPHQTSPPAQALAVLSVKGFKLFRLQFYNTQRVETGMLPKCYLIIVALPYFLGQCSTGCRTEIKWNQNTAGRVPFATKVSQYS